MPFFLILWDIDLLRLVLINQRAKNTFRDFWEPENIIFDRNLKHL